MRNNHIFYALHESKECTTVLTFNYLRLGYFCPTPTYSIGLPVE